MMHAHYRATIAFLAIAASFAADSSEHLWAPRAADDASGRIVLSPDGKATQIRFKSWPTEDFSAYPTHGYESKGRAVPIQAVRPPAAHSGDPDRGKRIWHLAPCVNCHTLPDRAAGDSRWAGTLGPTLGSYGARGRTIEYTYQMIHDPRTINPASIMPPWGSAGLLSPDDVLHLTAFLHSLKASDSNTAGTAHDPALRALPEDYFGDNLDPTRNPAALLAENAQDLWLRNGNRKQSCATCHGAEPDRSMAAAALRFPRYLKRYGRVMSLEDFLSAHGPEATGVALPVESAANLRLAMLIKMQSSGQPVQLDLKDPQNRAAWERGKHTFNKRVGQRNHACADCHSHELAAGKWLGGRYLGRADVSLGFTRGYPAWRTSFGEVWGLRRRIQWCMLPHGTNNLSAEAVEYAELELYLASFDHGKPMNAPGLKD